MEPNREKIINFIKSNGPVLPVQVSKFLNTNIIFAGAMLSELTANKHVLVTNTKKGGSPFYYLKGQEPQLANLGQYLSGKEKEAFDLIKERKVVKDTEILPWQRIALRAIKDFSIAIEVEFEGNKELFWKWYLASPEEINNSISQIFNIKEEIIENNIETETIPNEINIQESKKEIIKDNNHEEVLESFQKKLLEEEIIDKEVKIKKSDPRKRKKKEYSNNFDQSVLDYIKNKEIKIIEQNIIKSQKDMEYLVKIPSNVGELTFFLKAKNKKSINESDIALAYSSGQQRKLHTIILSNGSLTKKAKEYMEKNLVGQLTFINI